MKNKVTGIQAAWLGMTAGGTKFVRLLCVMAVGDSLYHTLWLTDKTSDRSCDALLAYGFVGELDDIAQLDDPKGAHSLFTFPEGGVDVIVKTEKYTPKGSSQEREVTKIDYLVALPPPTFKGIERSDIGKFKQDTIRLRKRRLIRDGADKTEEVPDAPVFNENEELHF